MLKKSHKTVVTGIGCLSGAGLTLGENMDSLFNQIRNLGPPKRFKTNHVHKFPVFEVPDEFNTFVSCNGKNYENQSGTANQDMGQNMEDRFKRGDNSTRFTRTTLLTLRAARDAVAQAGLSSADFFNKRIGVCIGTSIGSSLNSIRFYEDFRKSRSPELIPVERYLNSNPAACIARRFNLNGPVQTIVNACSSGTDALGVASSWIEQGLCDMAIAGGADELSRVTYNGFISLMITDHEPSRPFDATRNGLNLGEGAGIMVLEDKTHALANHRPPLGGILGYGMVCDGHHLVSPHPKGLGLRQAIDQALILGRVEKKDIAFINAHGTGTRDNDRVESIVLADLLPDIPFFSTKGCTGHTLGAAGALEAAFTIACLNQRKIPASVGFGQKADDTPSSPVAVSMEIRGKIALSQSLAFGGNNSVLILKGREG